MKRRVLVIAAAVAGALTLGGGIAFGCGDKFVLIGGGARVMRSKYPSRVLVFMNPASRVPAAEKEFHVEATLTAAGHKAKVVESEAEVEKALESGKYDLVLADTTDVPELRKRCGAAASKPAVLPLLYKPTAQELAAAEKEANCLVRPSKRSSDLLAVIDETMKDRIKGIAPNCPPVR
ncbi:MAG TPA: hypothetical protein VJ776_07355 [Thermoanaerobaculia bacterium]|nr:hypothetical protein [Thermoanaerobaculia bacterium]